MAVTDPVADALTKIRNASNAQHATVDVRASKFIARVLEVLQKEGYIRNFKEVGEKVTDKRYRVYLKFVKKTPSIQHIKRVSTPGVRVYRGAEKLPRVRRGLGVAVISTSQGVMSDREAYKAGVGGEVVCYIW